ncbi:hypothetical protein B0T14DRAFT_513997 [Immersiella caudata]|uniref:Uncharacterized protein n=1 Tax=Immersiella caudata TaxID=314043 RepID=A0AA39WVR7_9PEZI|nr:hypothetical protein B0T14DRAFT_513997 [Immersiella caudata]
MPTFRDNKFTKEETDMYVSELTEDNLDDGNPFKQGSAEPVVDADEAAMAAVLSRSLKEDQMDEATESIESNRDPANEKGMDVSAALQFQEHPATDPDEPRFSGLFSTSGESADHDLLQDSNRPQKRKYSRSSSTNDGTALTDDTTTSSGVDDSDPEVRRLIKRACKDSRSLLIQPDDSEKEGERKMRANVDLVGTVDEGEDEQANGKMDENSDANDEIDFAASDEASIPSEAKSLTLMEKLGEGKEHKPIPRDPGDEDDDIEVKEGDDYDVENYEKFEDDDEGTGKVTGVEELGLDGV